MDPTSMAASLLRHCDEPGPVADLLFERSGQQDWGPLCCAPSDDELTARLVASAGSTNAKWLVSTCRSPELLARIARSDSRLGIRRAIATNPATNRETLDFLLSWSCRAKNGDAECAQGLLRREVAPFSWSQVIDALKAGGVPENFDWSPVVQLVSEDATAQAYRSMVPFGFVAIGPLIGSVAHGIDGLTLDFVLDSVDETVLGQLLCNLMRNRTVTIDESLACRINAHWSSGSRFFSEHWLSNEAHSSLSAEAARVLVESDLPPIRSGLAGRATLPDDVICKLVQDNDPTVVAALARTFAVRRFDESIADALLARNMHSVNIELCSARQVSADFARRLVDALLSGKGFNIRWGHVLLQFGRHLTTSQRLAILRRGDHITTLQWVSMTDPLNPAGPRPGEITELVEDQGRAFCHSTVKPDEAEYRDAPECYRLIAEGVRLEHAPEAVWDEVLDGLPGLLTTQVAKATSAYLWRKLTVAFEENLTAWELFFGMAPEWDGTIPDLVATVYHLLEN